MKAKSVLLGLSLVALPVLAQTPVYLDDSKPVEERVEDALSRMTLEEKIAVTHAQSKFCSPGVARLGIPEFWMTDGPHGIRPEVLWDEWDQAGWTNDSCVAFPALTCLAATWDTDMSMLYGKSIGEEARYRNKTVLLGPGVNIYRTPLNGRNFEYMGEDPYLAGRMVVPYVQGVQQNGVAACVKHYALNNQEVNRHTTNVIVDDRALYEIYLPAFKAAVQEGKAWSIMGAYNLYKGQHACHNQYLLNDILKGEWGFDGVVVSDWGGVHDTDQAITNGLDMEFGSWTDGLSNGASNAYDNYYLADPYLERIQSGKAGTKELDDKVRRILRLAFRTTMDRNRPYGAMRSPEHYDAARKIGEAGIVLLQNNGNLLPIDLAKTKKIAVIGPMAKNGWDLLGSWCGHGKDTDVAMLYNGLATEFAGKAELRYAAGCATKGDNKEGFAEALEAARWSDVVVLCLGEMMTWSGENASRSSIALPQIQEELAAELKKAGKPIVLVLVNGRPLELNRLELISDAILEIWQPGVNGALPMAGILSGRINPSGKLAMTFPYSTGQIPIYYNRRKSGRGHQGFYKDITSDPLYPFGHGLSYTEFKYGTVTPSVTKVKRGDRLSVEVTVTNVGARDGAETVHWFISDPYCSITRPVKELKHFEKQLIRAGETKTFRFDIDLERDFGFVNEDGKRFLEAGEYHILVQGQTVKIELID